MSLIERAIGAISPSWAMRREAARQGLAMMRGYDSASTGRLAEGWNPSGNSPNRELEAAGTLIQRRSRDLARNNGWASVALRRLPASIVGTQVTASVTVPGERARKAVADDWAEFRETGNAVADRSWDADLSLITRTVVECGDCLVVWSFTPSSENRRVPLTWRALPPEYLDTNKQMGIGSDTVVINGVEVAPDGRVTGYWLYDRHPLDTVNGLSVPSTFYPADRVDLVHEPLWLGQRRGVPWLSPVALDIDDLQQYSKAALWKARMAAAFGLVMTSAGTPATPVTGIKPHLRGDGTTGERIGPGMILRPPPGSTATQITPPRDDNFKVFWDTRLFAIAAGIGLPVHALSGDLSGANYSSLREGKLLYWELVDCWQWHMLHDQLLRRAWRRFGQARFAAGRTTGGILPPVKWAFPKRPWVDPKKDIEAIEAELDLGLTTYPDAVAARGEDAEDQLAEVMAWKDKLAKAGISFGRSPKTSGQVPAAPVADPAAP
jgi:lambda family phage portal protein